MSLTPPPVTDIRAGDWIDRRLPENVRPYARLMRLDRPIGTWLLLLPCWWGVVLASPGWPSLWLCLLFAVGAIAMRGAGCIVNDIYDRDFDRLVERTKTRPLASGEMSVVRAIAFLTFIFLLASIILIQFNFFTRGLLLASLVLVFIYPLMKRITWYPQLVLGLTFNWGALVGWSAVQETLSGAAVLLYIAGVFWTLAYDTMYAHQDKSDDAIIGVKSLALRLGDRSRVWLGVFFAVALTLFAVAGGAAGEGLGFYVLWLVAAAHAAWQLWGWHMDDPANCARRFRSNRDFGLILLAALLAGKLI